MQLTATARERIAKELDDLRDEEQADTVGRQGAGGDPADLADVAQAYDRALARRTRITALERTLAEADDADEDAMHEEVVDGCAVTIRYVGERKGERFWVGNLESRGEDIEVITVTGPLGQALLGAKPGDTVAYKAPAGMLKVRVISIG